MKTKTIYIFLIALLGRVTHSTQDSDLPISVLGLDGSVLSETYLPASRKANAEEVMSNLRSHIRIDIKEFMRLLPVEEKLLYKITKGSSGYYIVNRDADHVSQDRGLYRFYLLASGLATHRLKVRRTPCEPWLFHVTFDLPYPRAMENETGIAHLYLRLTDEHGAPLTELAVQNLVTLFDGFGSEVEVCTLNGLDETMYLINEITWRLEGIYQVCTALIKAPNRLDFSNLSIQEPISLNRVNLLGLMNRIRTETLEFMVSIRTSYFEFKSVKPISRRLQDLKKYLDLRTDKILPMRYMMPLSEILGIEYSMDNRLGHDMEPQNHFIIRRTSNGFELGIRDRGKFCIKSVYTDTDSSWLFCIEVIGNNIGHVFLRNMSKQFWRDDDDLREALTDKTEEVKAGSIRFLGNGLFNVTSMVELFYYLREHHKENLRYAIEPKYFILYNGQKWPQPEYHELEERLDGDGIYFRGNLSDPMISRSFYISGY